VPRIGWRSCRMAIRRYAYRCGADGLLERDQPRRAGAGCVVHRLG
jgi:hypothetical protein